MCKKSEKTIQVNEVESVFNENRVLLKPTTKIFEIDERDDAVDYANRKRSYVGSAYNVAGELIGWYVPA